MHLRWVAAITLLGVLAGSGPEAWASGGEDILRASGVRGGLVVHIGCGDGQLTAGLRAGEGLIVHGLDRDSANVARAREHIRGLGLYGPVSADAFDGRHLPYVDNVVNLLVASDLGEVPMDEVMRVLAPRGVAYVQRGAEWTRTVKPRPSDTDEWTHYLHGPDNNAVAHDTVVGPPRNVQWLAGPLWTRNHHTLNSISSVVTANGRLFYIVDEETPADMSVPSRWALLCRDAYNGVTLWRLPMGSWAWHRVRFRSGPPQVQRLLAATDSRVYAPLGLDAPVSAIDAATGRVVDTYQASKGAEELIVTGNVLLVLAGSPVAEQGTQHPAFKGEYKAPNDKTVVALDAGDGRKLWGWSRPGAAIRPETLASDGARAYFQVGEAVVCLDLQSGKELWTFGQRDVKQGPARLSFGRHVLVVADGVVLCKLADSLTALSASDGSRLWEAPGGSGFHAPPDLFVIGGLVWEGSHPKDAVAPPPADDFSRARDLRTGQVTRENQIMVDLQTAGHHHRCYRNKATDRYILTGKRGVEMMDLVASNHSRNNWVRGTCQYGVLPANGLLYAPPHSCGCYPESKLWGFWALAASRPVIADRAGGEDPPERLEKGPAFAKVSAPAGEADDAASWPQYRHDALRSGIAGTDLPGDLRPCWSADIGGRLTQPVAGGGLVVVSAVDAHSVHALDEKTGRVVWRRLVGGRVDSAPTIHQQAVLFGCADGWVYCLNLRDGELAWRFRAARADLRTVALDRVESVWPVHGSVMLLNGVLYCAAGRSTWLDGGIDLYGLEPSTGAVLYRHQFASRHPVFGEGRDQAKAEHDARFSQNLTDYRTFLASDRSDSFTMAAGAVNDVLVSDGQKVFLHQTTFDAALQKQDTRARHLFSTSGLLDDAENHRSHWVLGTGDFSRVPVAYSWIVNRTGKRAATLAVPIGLMMVYGHDAAWVVQRKGGAAGAYRLVQRAHRPFSADEPSLPDFRKPSAADATAPLWQVELPVRPRAMIKSAGLLLLGCMPLAPQDADPQPGDAAAKAGSIRIFSAGDGSKVGQIDLPLPVVWDGMSAAHGKLFVSTTDGRLSCWGGR